MLFIQENQDSILIWEKILLEMFKSSPWDISVVKIQFNLHIVPYQPQSGPGLDSEMFTFRPQYTFQTTQKSEK